MQPDWDMFHVRIPSSTEFFKYSRILFSIFFSNDVQYEANLT